MTTTRVRAEAVERLHHGETVVEVKGSDHDLGVCAAVRDEPNSVDS